MAPDFRKDDDRYTFTGISTSTTYNTTDTVCSRVAYSYTYTQPNSRIFDSYDVKFLEKLAKIKKIARMMMGWVEEKPEIKRIILRPAIQLRGVSFGGRGWA